MRKQSEPDNYSGKSTDLVLQNLMLNFTGTLEEWLSFLQERLINYLPSITPEKQKSFRLFVLLKHSETIIYFIYVSKDRSPVMCTLTNGFVRNVNPPTHQSFYLGKDFYGIIAAMETNGNVPHALLQDAYGSLQIEHFRNFQKTLALITKSEDKISPSEFKMLEQKPRFAQSAPPKLISNRLPGLVLSQAIDPNTCFPGTSYPLIIGCVIHKHYSYISDFLDKMSAKKTTEEILGQIDSKGRVALHYAADADSLEVCQLIINKGGRNSLYCNDADGLLPVHYAKLDSQVKAYLDDQCKEHRQEDIPRLLCQAIQEFSTDKVRRLTHQADTKDINKAYFEYHPLCAALFIFKKFPTDSKEGMKAKEMVKILLDKKADLSQIVEPFNGHLNDTTPLHSFLDHDIKPITDNHLKYLMTIIKDYQPKLNVMIGEWLPIPQLACEIVLQKPYFLKFLIDAGLDLNFKEGENSISLTEYMQKNLETPIDALRKLSITTQDKSQTPALTQFETPDMSLRKG